MAVKGTTWPTLVDVARRVDPDGVLRAADIAETMNAVNPILDDMPMLEGNLTTGHQGTIRTGLPPIAWRLLNYGTPAGKSTTKQVTDTCGIMEAYSRLDKEVYNLNGASAAFRMSEDEAFIEGMSQEFARTLFYGNTDVNPEKFLGLAPRFSALSTDPTQIGYNIIDCGGTGSSDNTSVWLIAWGKRTIHGIYPKGSAAGLEYQNLGESTFTDPNGNMMQVLISHFIQRCGIHLKDWGGVVRLANIDVSDLKTTWAFILTSMIDAWYKIPLRLRAKGVTRPVIYCNSTVKTAIDKAALDKSVNQLTAQVLEDGQILTRFWGMPIKECDAIINTEGARIV